MMNTAAPLWILSFFGEALPSFFIILIITNYVGFIERKLRIEWLGTSTTSVGSTSTSGFVNTNGRAIEQTRLVMGPSIRENTAFQSMRTGGGISGIGGSNSSVGNGITAPGTSHMGYQSIVQSDI
jgi:hypothetical protein